MMPVPLFRIALFFFLLAAGMGAVLRWAFVGELPGLAYRHWVHAHSHVAMLGWLYLALYALLLRAFVPASCPHQRFYRGNAALTILSVLGMAISFPLEGYGAWSGAFSAAHGLLSYAFAFRLLRDMEAEGPARTFVRTALGFMVLSTLALWAMPVLILLGQQGKAIYYMAVQFYLHFQFNGWLLFACLALLFQWMQHRPIAVDTPAFRRFYTTLVLATLLTYALAIAWSTPGKAVFALNSLGVLLQLLALGYFALGMRRALPLLRPGTDGWSRLLLGAAAASFVLKMVIQSAVVIPYVATISFTIRNYVIGFIHLVLLGAVSFFLLVRAGEEGMLDLRAWSGRAGIILLLAGFAGSEALLFLQGTLFWANKGFLPGYYPLLWGVSMLIPVGVLLLLLTRTLPQGAHAARPES